MLSPCFTQQFLSPLSFFLFLFSLFLLSFSSPLSLAIVKLLSVESMSDRSSHLITKPDRSSRRIGFLDRRGGEASGAADMGMVARGQHGGDRRGDRCGDWHRDWCLVGLVASVVIGIETDVCWVWWC